jgi:hypothetical protein
METPASFTQAAKLISNLGKPSADEIQNLISATDLLKMMMRANLQKVDRSAFRALLVAPVLYDKSPEELLAMVKKLNADLGWGFDDQDFPSVPRGADLRDGKLRFPCVYLPNEDGELGFLRSFREFWRVLPGPADYSTWHAPQLVPNAGKLRQVAGYDYRPGIRWVELDPTAYQGLSTQDALAQSRVDGTRLADIEVLMAILLFPSWALTWSETIVPSRDDVPAPYLAGLEFCYDDGWSSGPYLCASSEDRVLKLRADWPGNADLRWASPTIKEC